MTTIKAIMVTLILALNLFLSFAITLEAAIESNLRILEIFKRNVFGGVLSYHKTIVQFHGYSKTIVFGIPSNFTYHGSSRSQVFFKIGALKKWLLDLQLCLKEIPIQVFSCEICKVLKNTRFAKFLRIFLWNSTSGGCLWYNSETYDMVKLSLSLDSNFFSVF